MLHYYLCIQHCIGLIIDTFHKQDFRQSDVGGRNEVKVARKVMAKTRSALKDASERNEN